VTPFAADGLAVCLVEHDMTLVMDVCETVHVLDFGKLIDFYVDFEFRSVVLQKIIGALFGEAVEEVALSAPDAARGRGREEVVGG
jgi:ABC-type methionine transport system ATPase subunit